MKRRISISLRAIMAAMVLTTVGQLASAHSTLALHALDLKNQRQPAPNITVAGQPDKAQLAAAAKAGIKYVINLRTDKEMSFDEAAEVAALGMQYYSLPIGGAGDLSFDNASKLDALLRESGGAPVLLHCASGNRVGALKAISAYSANPSDVDSAIEAGKRWGLTRLEAAVRKAFAQIP